MMIPGNKLCGHILWKLENKSNSDLSDKMQIALNIILWKWLREGVPQKKSRIVGNFPYFGQIFFAFLNELDHSKQFLKK